MTLNSVDIIFSLAVGVLATLVMDIWLALRKRLFGLPALNYCFLGRWILHMPAGRLRHENISRAEEKTGECLIGRAAHYSIGAAFGFLLVLVESPSWLSYPSLLPALVCGVATVAAPLFVMQPCFGFGIAGSKMPNPNRARVQSLITHTVFGFGLYLAAWLIRAVA